MIKVISFDMDGTLEHGKFDRIFWDKLIIREFAKENRLKYGEAYDAVWVHYKSIGKFDMRWYDINYWIRRFNIRLSKKQLIDEGKKHIRVFQETRPVIKRFSQDYKLVITSNAIREFLTLKLEAINMDDYFEKIYSCTSDLKTVKNEKIFLKVLKELKVKPEEMAHIGDDIDFDCRIPRRLGIHAFYLDRGRKTKGKYVVHSLKDFELRIKRLS